MIDKLNRNIEYIRISVTDRCNLRCIYCMPREGVVWQPHEEILSYDELLRLCGIFAQLGISKVKLTGGEPLVRGDLHALIRGLKQIDGIDNVTLTTNGLLLAGQLDALVGAGLDAVNISIDTTDEAAFKQITGSSGAREVKAAIMGALACDQLRVKLNCVPLKGINPESLFSLAEFAKDNRVSVRFIEMMPIGLGTKFETYSEDELRPMLESRLGPLVFYEGKLGNGPCRYYTAEGYTGKIGFISAVTHRFCEKCNRIRLTSDGFLKTCLQYNAGADLKTVLRGGASDEELAGIIRRAVYDKPEGHHFGCERLSGADEHSMFQIGG